MMEGNGTGRAVSIACVVYGEARVECADACAGVCGMFGSSTVVRVLSAARPHRDVYTVCTWRRRLAERSRLATTRRGGVGYMSEI